MVYTKSNLQKLAVETGFLKDNLEKFLRLVAILKFVYTNDFLKEHLVLKGGTAINLICVNLPRLSVDLDFDFAINYSKDQLDDIKTKIKTNLFSILNILGYSMNPDYRSAHALDSFRFNYINNGHNKEIIKIDLNYIDRAHIFKLEKKKLLPSKLYESFEILTLNTYELYAAKLNALISRGAVRDLFDVTQMIDNKLITDLNLFRKCFIFYDMTGGNQNIDNISFEAMDKINYHKVKTDLKWLLIKENWFDVEPAKTKAKEFITNLLSKMTNKEKEFVKEFRAGNYQPTLLFDDPTIISNIQNHPMALWRCREKKSYE